MSTRFSKLATRQNQFLGSSPSVIKQHPPHTTPTTTHHPQPPLPHPRHPLPFDWNVMNNKKYKKLFIYNIFDCRVTWWKWVKTIVILTSSSQRHFMNNSVNRSRRDRYIPICGISELLRKQANYYLVYIGLHHFRMKHRHVTYRQIQIALDINTQHFLFKHVHNYHIIQTISVWSCLRITL